ncbi:23S ribosomal RNA methyltransferase [Ascodesmis nigricans]|uniref:rRNA methyltransferase 2, mitochondrial n=1 Tax=Ascodesmis nigricans TaxID=341454 RepID=A0A4V3SHJ8_9PEZI|nr:23S ribosomal RNA methyltransferase [Ascodesmis nigricans]
MFAAAPRVFRSFTRALVHGTPWSAPQCLHAQAAAAAIRHNSHSSTIWKTRQQKDPYRKKADVKDLRSRAAFKLYEIHDKYRIFRRGQTVVDLGYAPGSWSQVAAEQVAPRGRVLGVDLIPALPPKGVSTLQGDFLSPSIQASIKEWLADSDRGRPLVHTSPVAEQSYLERERREAEEYENVHGRRYLEENDQPGSKMVDIVLSDMWEPWPLTDGLWKRSLTAPYNRLMNTSGIRFKDHAGSMDLCNAALHFALDVLKPDGHFVCKFYAGQEDKVLEQKLKKCFAKVHREKPNSSRPESREAYFVALRLKRGACREWLKEWEPEQEKFGPSEEDEEDY